MPALTKFKNLWLLKIIFFCLVVIPLVHVGVVESHVPYLALDKNKTLDNALRLSDIQISKVIYQVLNETSDQSWIAFEAEPGQILNLEIGLPALEQVRNIRPTIVLIKPSESNQSPIELIDSHIITNGAKLTPFHEPFTDTNSWILTKKEISISETGLHHLVSLDLEDNTGKLWVAIGKEERFGVSDIARLPSTILEVRKFHDNDQNGNTNLWNHQLFVPLSVILVAIGAVGLSLLALKIKKSNEHSSTRSKQNNIEINR